MTFLPQFVSPSDPYAAGKLMFLGLMFVVVSTPISLALIWSAGSISTFLEALAEGDACRRLPVRRRDGSLRRPPHPRPGEIGGSARPAPRPATIQ